MSDELEGRPIVWEVEGERFAGYLEGIGKATSWVDGVTQHFTFRGDRADEPETPDSIRIARNYSAE